MVDVSTVVSSLLSMFRVRCFGSIASAFRKYSESRKYYEMFGIITQIQTTLNLGTIPNFRNHCEIFGTIPRFRNFFTHGRPYYDANCRQDYRLNFHASNLLCFAVPLFSKPILTKKNIASTLNSF